MCEWTNGEQLFYPCFDNPEPYAQWSYHPENQGVTNLIDRGLAFKTKEEAINVAIGMIIGWSEADE